MLIFYKALTIPSKATINNYVRGSIRNRTQAVCQTLFENLAIEPNIWKHEVSELVFMNLIIQTLLH